jgi:23S rRNA pseudouridine1911/1915/1917 synthase
MVCAKNSQTLAFLQKQFSNRKIIKTYQAIIEKEPEHKEAIIDAPIGRNPLKPQTFRVHKEGKPAQTHYKMIATNPNSGNCLVELSPKTGRTHQLRVHLAYIKRPIIGDVLYGGADADRLLLHAKSLTLKLPNGEDRTFESTLPKEFTEYVDQH